MECQLRGADQVTTTSETRVGGERASGKSTQKAFILSPYRKLAKLSLKRARLSCMSCKCIIFASRSAMASDSSAKAGSKVLRGKGASRSRLALADSRKEERDGGRRGVVGRDVRVRELDRFALESPAGSVDDISGGGGGDGDGDGDGNRGWWRRQLSKLIDPPGGALLGIKARCTLGLRIGVDAIFGAKVLYVNKAGAARGPLSRGFIFLRVSSKDCQLVTQPLYHFTPNAGKAPKITPWRREHLRLHALCQPIFDRTPS